MYIVRKREDEDCYRATSLQYNKQGGLWFASEQTWELEWNELGEWWDCVNDEVHKITEFHGSGRARYMTRQRDPDAVNFILPGTTRWSDYDDDVIYGDYVVDEDTGNITNTTAYLPGIAQMDTQTGNVMYMHSDQIGSLRAITIDYGEPIQRIVYTAFGEKVHEDGTVGTRYQYAGEYGYQSNEDLTFVHVGHRYYDPSTGRFLQRDPIGILGGLNVYAYTGNNPLSTMDPDGLTYIQTPGGIWVPQSFPSPTPPSSGWRWGLPGLKVAGRLTAISCIGMIAIEAADRAAVALDADTARKQRLLQLGIPLPLPNRWYPWNWGIYADSGWIRSPGRWVMN